MLATIRQWVHPPEFRITAADADEGAAWKQLAALIGSREPPSARRDSEGEAGLFARIGTHLWRLRSKLIEPGAQAPRDEFKRAYRHLEAAWDALAETGVEVIDPSGRPFDPGLSLKAVAFQPVPGLPRATVIETLKPTILLKGLLIQTGEVIVGTPEESGRA